VHQGALRLIDVEEGAANWCRQRAASVADQTANHSRWSPPKRVHATTLSDLLANRWQTAVQSPPGMRQAGCWTRPVLLVWCGAPRRNRTGDPILTIRVVPLL
jgi:hypothetical protein